MEHLIALSVRLMTQPIFGMHPNGCESVLENQTLFEHVLKYHVLLALEHLELVS